MKPILFIADLHLSDDTPDLNGLFAEFLRQHAKHAAALYIMGDLFEAWTGDDDSSQTAAEVAAQLRDFSQHAPVYFIAGNRDFLLGQDYATRANLILLPEHHLINWQGNTILLTHGDEMCTEDVSYLRYRRIIRHPVSKWLLRRLPRSQRQRIANNIRAQSRARKQNQQNYFISDVSQQGIEAACKAYPQINIIIHGHTHRPNIHTHLIHQRSITRYVLPDWKNGEGGYLKLNQHGLQLFRLPETANP